jgi:hypothetical protein
VIIFPHLSEEHVFYASLGEIVINNTISIVRRGQEEGDGGKKREGALTIDGGRKGGMVEGKARGRKREERGEERGREEESGGAREAFDFLEFWVPTFFVVSQEGKTAFF